MSIDQSRSTRRQRRAEIQSRLCEVALRRLEHQPFRDLVIDDLAREAGLSRSSFYFYFRDKQALLMAVTQDVAAELYSAADEWWHGKGEPETLIRTTFNQLGAIYERYASIIRAANEAATYDSEFNALWRSIVDRFIDATSARLERELLAGTIVPVDPRHAAEAIVWMVERQLNVYVTTGERSAAEVAEALASLWIVALYGPTNRE